MLSIAVENVGSTARDYCMLERNILSHCKLAVLLLLLSSATLLHTRLPAAEPDNQPKKAALVIGIASLLAASGLGVIVAGVFEYFSGHVDMMRQRAFFRSTKCVLPFHRT